MKLSIEKIECQMARLGYNQNAVAIEMEVVPSAVSNLLSSIRRNIEITPIRAGRLAKALSVDIEKLREE